MSEYVDCLKTALFRAKECAKSLRLAADVVGIDIDEPLQEGLAPRPPDDDIDFPDHVPTTTPLDPDLDNPQSRARGGVYLLTDLLSRQ